MVGTQLSQGNRRISGLFRQAVLVVVCCAAARADGIPVPVLVEGAASVYAQALRGFEQAFANPGSYQQIQLSADVRQREGQLAALRKTRPRLVVAIGTQAARTARAQLPDTPLLYCLALNPRQNGLSGRDIGGVALEIAPSEQLAAIQRVLPAVKRIGVIYDEATSGDLVREVQRSLKGGVRLAPHDARTPRDAGRAIEEVVAQVDAFWLLWDPVIFNPANFKTLVELSLRNKVALIAPAAPLVEAGALMSLGPDYVKAGRRAGEMAHLILTGKARAGDFAEPPPDPILTINGQVAKRLQIAIPRDVPADILSPEALQGANR